MAKSEQGAREFSPATPSGNSLHRWSLTILALLSAASLALPTAFYYLTLVNSASDRRATSNAATLAVVLVVAAIYAFLVLRAGDARPAIVAGVSTSLGVLGVIALAPVLLLVELDSGSRDSASRNLLIAVLAYAVVQFPIALAARQLAGKARRFRTERAYYLGIAVPVMFAIGVSAAETIPRRMEEQQFVAAYEAREQVRPDLFALYACAAAHRARDPRHDYPASLEALGPDGDKCLPVALASGEQRGWTFTYTRRTSTADSAAGFTVNAAPQRGGTSAKVLTIDEQGLVREGWMNTTLAPPFRPTPPALAMLIAIRECDKIYRASHGGPPSDLIVLRAFVDSSSRGSDAPGCYRLKTVSEDEAWADYGQTRRQYQWLGKFYSLTVHRRYSGDPSLVAYEVRPSRFGVTGVWSYLGLSSGTMYGTTEPRAATTGDAVIPRCEFGQARDGSAQCVPGSSAPPNATLVVDPVVAAGDFKVSLADAADSTAEGTAAGFQYAFSCAAQQGNEFVKDSSVTCSAPWNVDSLEVEARIRNRDFAEREYTRWVRVTRPPLAVSLTTPRPVVLGDVLVLEPRGAGRDRREQLDYAVQIGDAAPTTRSLPGADTLLRCRAATSQQSFQCMYPAKPGRYAVHLKVRGWHGDSASAITQATVSQPKLLRLPPAMKSVVHVGGAYDFLVVELLVDWPAEHGQTRLVRDAVGSGDIARDPPRIGTVRGIYPERAQRASDGLTVVPIAFPWSELVKSGAVVRGTREIVLDGTQGSVHDLVQYRQRIAVEVRR